VKISIAGAGVSGLTCGVVLAERGHDVTIAASEIGAASLAAGAVWFPYDCSPEESVVAWALVTYGRLLELARDRDSGVSMVEFRCLDVPAPAWASTLGARAAGRGFTVNVPLMETPAYLDYLRKRFAGNLQMGIRLQSLEELDGDVVVNCSGVGARLLANDEEVEPHRGQVVVVDRLDLPGTLVAETALAYAIPRSTDCILGGTNDVSDRLDPDPAQTAAIIDLCHRELGTSAHPPIRDVKVGLRPFRRSGIRLEAARLADGRAVVHNYGHGGSGFTVSWGCAESVAAIVEGL
jgi:D-amino-acid oxidase